MRRSSKDPLYPAEVRHRAAVLAYKWAPVANDTVVMNNQGFRNGVNCGFVAGVEYAKKQIESGKAQVTIKLALCKKCKCEFGVNVLDKGVCEFCRGQAAIASDPKPKKRGAK